MRVEGDEAARWKAVRLDTFAEYNELVVADSDTGELIVRTKTGSETVFCDDFRLLRKPVYRVFASV